ncbi:MAG: transporter substrate-binding domain-containing diguanylate cyclase, partial [Marinicella sp.]
KVNYVEVADEMAGILAVLDGEVDVFIGSMLSVNNYIQANGFNEVKIAGWAGPEDLLRVGVTKNNTALLQAINQFIDQISETERITMHKNWNNITFIDNTNYALTKNVILIFSIIFLAGILYHLVIRKLNIKLTKQNHELTSLKAELTKSNQELLFLTHHDLLTQVFNRHYFNQVIDQKSNNFDQQMPICMVFFDIDHFKLINDIYGHTQGDMVLKSIATCIKAMLSEQHILVRWGGEEFIIMCQQTDELETRRLCQDISVQLKKLNIKPVENVTCSFGIAKKQDNETIMMCIERADRAMYQAKANGRNQIITAEKMDHLPAQA